MLRAIRAETFRRNLAQIQQRSVEQGWIDDDGRNQRRDRIDAQGAQGSDAGVIDTNVLVSAMLTAGTSAKLVEAIRTGRLQPVRP